ncbi:MAG TPA: hypothetical protein VK640_05120 [Actinomycetes bacterium]|nr:hypothetical protein [Actinomycetes bacterium]
MRAPRRPLTASGGDRLLAVLQSCPATQRVTVRLSTSTPRTRRSIAELLQAHAFAAHCQIAVAETRGIAVRWVDGIVSGTASELAEFLATVTPVLDRSHGRASLGGSLSTATHAAAA